MSKVIVDSYCIVDRLEGYARGSANLIPCGTEHGLDG